MPTLKDLGTHSGQSGGVSAFFRGRRMNFFRRLIRDLPRPLRILDLGGTESYWESMGAVDTEAFQITLLNLEENLKPARRESFTARLGDATDLSDIDRSEFDLVYSNSVIEHLFTGENQRRMAEQIASLDLPFWVQTPNFWFPMEPHFHVLGWQWLPREIRIKRLHEETMWHAGAHPRSRWSRSEHRRDPLALRTGHA
ncbi:class I SAM-dependent methyltransferase [bacterium]|nr:class I SAM-dependent methyltransferase [bacterium]